MQFVRMTKRKEFKKQDTSTCTHKVTVRDCPTILKSKTIHI